MQNINQTCSQREPQHSVIYTDFRQKHPSVCSLTFHRLNHFTSCAEFGLINALRSDIQQKWKHNLQKGPDHRSWIRITQLPWWIGDGPNTDQVEFRAQVCVNIQYWLVTLASYLTISSIFSFIYFICVRWKHLFSCLKDKTVQ